MAEDEAVSANTGDLDAFVRRSDTDIGLMAATHEGLQRGRVVLSALSLPFHVAESTIPSYATLAEFLLENGGFVRDISSALKNSGVLQAGGIYSTTQSRIETELDKSDAERLDELEATLVAQGITPGEAGKIKAEVMAQLDRHPELSFYDAVLAGTASYQGITVEELAQRNRAFRLYPAEVGTVINDNFDALASLSGDSDKITVEDLHHAIEDESLPQDVRDAAYRLAADGILFTNMDVAKQTDLTDEPLENGFDWRHEDGEIGREDAEQFNEKNHRAEILTAWHPLIETANQGYDLTRADSHAGRDDVIAFVNDEEIPLYVRRAVFDVYADKHDLALHEHGGQLYASGVSEGRAAPTAPIIAPPAISTPPTPGPVGGPPAGGGGPGSAVAAVVVLTVISGKIGWDYGRKKAIERDGNPAFVHTHPLTGANTVLDLDQLDELSPEEAKAWAAYFAIYGGPPSNSFQQIEQIEPHPYLDADGQWRMSDTDQPVNVEPLPPPPEGQFYDNQERLRYKDGGDLVDAEPEPQLATDGAGARSGGGRRVNPPPGDSDVWQGFQVLGNGRKTNGLRGRNRRYYEWDYTHNDIEVYDQLGRHLGSMDPVTGEMYKPAVENRTIDLG